MIKTRIAFFLLLLMALVPATRVLAQSTEFVYQGQMQNGGSPANGNYDFEFLLFDALSAGSQVGVTLTKTGIPVANGIFSTKLDFGSNFPGANRFLELHVRPTGGGTFTPLSPRSQILSVPYSIRALTVSGPVTGTSSSATLTVTNAQPGVTNPSLANLPPAALKGEATATNDSNVGVLGVGDGSTGIGVFGLTNGSGAPGANAVGVYALATSTTGKSTGLSAEIASPDGTAIEARTSATGLIFKGGSDDTSSSNPKITISALGNITTNGGVRAKNFFTNNGTVNILGNGDIGTVGSIEGASLTTSGNATVGGALNVAGTLSGTNLTTSGNVIVGNTLTVAQVTAPNANPINFNGSSISTTGNGNFGSVNTGPISGGNVTVGGLLTVAQISAPNANPISLNGSSISTTGNGNFGSVNTGLISGGDAHICTLSSAPNVLRFCSSSLRYKKNINSFTGGLGILNRLHPISFNWKENGAPGLGLGAEEVEKVEPRLTFKNGNGEVEGVKYGELNIVLINAIKEQQAQIEAQAKQIAALQSLVCHGHRQAAVCRTKK